MTAPKTIFKTKSAPAPNPSRKPHKISQHGDTRTDYYAWMRDDNWQNVLRDPALLKEDIRAHIDAENTYYEEATAGLEDLREQLFEEMRGRIKEDESSVPAPDGPFLYGSRFRKGGDYPIIYRTLRDGTGEEILFDGDAEGKAAKEKGAEFFDIGAVAHSPDHRLIAHAVDCLGSEYFDIKIRKMSTEEEFPETVSSTDGNPVWAADSKSFYYVERDDNQRPKRVKQHKIGSDPSLDTLIYEEQDDGFFLSIGKTQSDKYIIIDVGNSTSSESHYIRSDAPFGSKPTLIAPRHDDELYSVEHHGEHFYIQTNQANAVDFKIMRAPINNTGRDQWQEWLPHEAGTYVIDFIPYKDHNIRLIRKNALPQIIIADYDRTSETPIDFPEAAFSLGLSSGYEFDTDIVRFQYSSPSTPQQVFDYAIKTGERTLLKTQTIPSGHNAELYQVERIFAVADDGAQIPITILRLKTTKIDGTAPLLLYGYGSYGITIPAGFSTSVLSVVDRGAVYAIGHIRGGAAKGRQWYLDGKLANKQNTFTDFACVAQTLQTLGYGKKNQTIIYGGSAGGLLVGATLNLKPELFGGVIGAVPFIDVINTISDKDLPLTPPEWDEWGNPINDPQAFETIKSYSPYENIKPDNPYPPILATGGLTDYRVTYWEPAKWVAELRNTNPGGPFFLKMNMGAGHGGSAARFESLREKAHDYAFALAVFGLEKQPPIKHRS